MLEVEKNQHIGWDDATGFPINEYVFSVSDASELPASPWVDPLDGSSHIIAHGSRGWDITGHSVYGFDDGVWKLQFTMNG